jgi:hypothetical protein
MQAGYGDIAVAALVGGEQRAFEAFVREHFDLLERQATLLSKAA